MAGLFGAGQFQARSMPAFVLAALFVAFISIDSAFIGYKPALACCYDPPEPVIEPDPATLSAPTSDSQEEVAPAYSAPHKAW